MSEWSLVTCVEGGAAASRVAALLPDGRVVGISPLAAYSDVASVLEEWEALAPMLRAWRPADGVPLTDVCLLAPVPSPRKLICAGANYHSHLREMGVAQTPRGLEPFFFLLPPTSIAGPGEAVIIEDDPTARVDWEAELGVVIGRRARDIPVEHALEAVAGYLIVNDITARGRHARGNPLAPPFAYDWLASKGRDTFTPIGPDVTPSWFVPDPQTLSVRLWRNGVLEQDGSTSDMITAVAQLVSEASALMTLEPGDVIATGTPAGVGVAKGASLAPGDRLSVEIGPLGRLDNPVRLAPRAQPADSQGAIAHAEVSR